MEIMYNLTKKNPEYQEAFLGEKIPSEPWKNPFYFPLDPGCLIVENVFHGLWNNPHITG